jgi:hypothetical protein
MRDAPFKKGPAENGCHIRSPLSVPRNRPGRVSADSDTPVGQTVRARFSAWVRSTAARYMRFGL